MTVESELRPAAAWALARIAPPPAVAERAAAALAHCLDALAASAWPDAVACWSDLNADGCPLELAFSSRDRAVRFTAEAAPPEVPEAQRLARACERLAALGGTHPPDDVCAWLDELHAAGPLAWGAAVAGRHAESGDRFKLYAEAPPGARDAELARAGLSRAPRLVMVGWESGSDVVERYYRSEGFAAGDVARVLDACGMGGRAKELARAVSAAWPGTADRALAAVWGLSVAGPRGGDWAAVSLFKEATKVFGGDAACVAGLARIVRELDAGDLAPYARVAAPLAEVRGTGAHGMLALTVARDRPLEVRIGLSPLAAWRASRA